MIEAVQRPERYDLERDIGAQRNFAEANPDVVARLTELIESARTQLGDYNQIGEGARVFDERPTSHRER